MLGCPECSARDARACGGDLYRFARPAGENDVMPPTELVGYGLAGLLEQCPGGSAMATGPEVTAEGLQPGSVLVSNLDALLYLALVTAAAAVVAGALLRRRDL